MEFEHQTGGHAGNFLKPSTTKLMKAVSKGEALFYSQLEEHYPDLIPFVPTYYGSETRDSKTFVVLEDLTHDYKRPCIMDIKMGTQSYGEDASPEKQQLMKIKDETTTTHSLGFRITALNVYLPQTSTNNSTTLNKKRKSWGRSISNDTMLNALKEFFPESPLCVQILNGYLAKLKELLNWFEKQQSLRFYSSSLLFLYDTETTKCDVKMIDFAHVFPILDGGKDEGYLYGLHNLIQYFEQLKK